MDNPQTTLKNEFYGRLDDVAVYYDWTEMDEVVRSFAVIGELLDLTFDGKEAATVMTVLKEVIRNGHRNDWSLASIASQPLDSNWRQTWEDIQGWEDTSTTGLIDQLHTLHVFAKFGIDPLWSLAGNPNLTSHMAARVEQAQRDTPSYIESICVKVDRIRELTGVAFNLSDTLLARDASRARLKLDNGTPITLHELAALSGVTPKRIQNAIYAKTDEAPLVGKNGLIAPEACEPWLSARDYQRSLWKQVNALAPLVESWGADILLTEVERDEVIEDYIFIPVANDGSVFHPGLMREGRYAIGQKGVEQAIESFEQALDQLSKMETPRWRRPNSESGNWGIVSGQSWKRVRRGDLDRAAQ